MPLVSLLLTLLLGAPTAPAPADRAAVDALASRRFAAREDATRALAARGPRAAAALARGARSHDPEVRRRCRDLLEAQHAARLAALRGDQWPMIDALWFDPDRKAYRLDGEPWEDVYARHVGYLDRRGRDFSPWHAYRAATGDLVEDWLAAGWPDALVRAALAEMHRRDAVFLGAPAWR